MRRTLDPCWVIMTFLWVSPTVAFQPVLPIYQLPSKVKALLSGCGLTVPLHRLPSMLSFMCHLRQRRGHRHAALLRIPSLITKVPSDACWQSNGEGRSLTCMASIVSLTTMSGFTLAVNCPPLGSLAPSCRIPSCLFFPFRLPADWERSELADSWLRFLSHMQPDTPN